MTERKRICIRGHDTAVVGRNASNDCKECARMRYHKLMLPSLRYQWLPAQPLVDIVHREYVIHDFPANYQRIFHRAQRAGRITIDAADRFACHVLHTHPAMIWEEWYE